MDTINEKSTRMPGVVHDPDAGLVTINGEAYPEDVIASFDPIIEKLSAILTGSDAKSVEIRFELQYFNSGSCLLYTSPSPRDSFRSRMPSSA